MAWEDEVDAFLAAQEPTPRAAPPPASDWRSEVDAFLSAQEPPAPPTSNWQSEVDAFLAAQEPTEFKIPTAPEPPYSPRSELFQRRPLAPPIQPPSPTLFGTPPPPPGPLDEEAAALRGIKVPPYQAIPPPPSRFPTRQPVGDMRPIQTPEPTVFPKPPLQSRPWYEPPPPGAAPPPTPEPPPEPLAEGQAPRLPPPPGAPPPDESYRTPGARFQPFTMDEVPPEWNNDQEMAFRQWYAQQIAAIKEQFNFQLSPNPDDREHHYNWRMAFAAGATFDPETGHWPSAFKDATHPNRFVNGEDTITGELVVGPPEGIPQGTTLSMARTPDEALAPRTTLSMARTNEQAAAQVPGAGAAEATRAADAELRRRQAQSPREAAAEVAAQAQARALAAATRAGQAVRGAAGQVKEAVQAIPGQVMGGVRALPGKAAESLGRTMMPQRGVVSGIAGTGLESTGGAISWLGGELPGQLPPDPRRQQMTAGELFSKVGGGITAAGQAVQRAVRPPDEVLADPMDDPKVLLSPDWWAFNIGTLAGSVAGFAIPGEQVGGAMGAAGRMLAWSERAKSVLQGIGYTAGGTIVESLTEGALAYNDARQQGKTHEEAAAIAATVAKQNVALIGLTAGLAYIPPAKTVTRAAARAILPEAIQEGGQEIIANVAAGRPAMQGVVTSTVLGGLGGPAIGGLEVQPRPTVKQAPFRPVAAARVPAVAAAENVRPSQGPPKPPPPVPVAAAPGVPPPVPTPPAGPKVGETVTFERDGETVTATVKTIIGHTGLARVTIHGDNPYDTYIDLKATGEQPPEAPPGGGVPPPTPSPTGPTPTPGTAPTEPTGPGEGAAPSTPGVPVIGSTVTLPTGRSVTITKIVGPGREPGTVNVGVQYELNGRTIDTYTQVPGQMPPEAPPAAEGEGKPPPPVPPKPGGPPAVGSTIRARMGGSVWEGTVLSIEKDDDAESPTFGQPLVQARFTDEKGRPFQQYVPLDALEPEAAKPAGVAPPVPVKPVEGETPARTPEQEFDERTERVTAILDNLGVSWPPGVTDAMNELGDAINQHNSIRSGLPLHESDKVLAALTKLEGLVAGKPAEGKPPPPVATTPTRPPLPTPEGWTLEVGKTSTKEGRTAEAEVDYYGKRIVFSDQKHLDNPEIRNHEIGHVIIERVMPDAARDSLENEYRDYLRSTPERTLKGLPDDVDVEWVIKNKFDHERMAMDAGNYFTHPDRIPAELRALFDKHLGQYIPGTAAAPGKPPPPVPGVREPWQMTQDEHREHKRATQGLPEGHILSMRGEQIAKDDFKSRSNDELRTLAGAMGLPTAGSKKALVERIKARSAAFDLATSATIDKMRTWNQGTLSQLLRDLGGSPTDKNRKQLVAAIVEQRETVHRIRRARMADTVHERALQTALRAGRDVSDEILKDYPQLAKFAAEQRAYWTKRRAEEPEVAARAEAERVADAAKRAKQEADEAARQAEHARVSAEQEAARRAKYPPAELSTENERGGIEAMLEHMEDIQPHVPRQFIPISTKEQIARGPAESNLEAAGFHQIIGAQKGSPFFDILVRGKETHADIIKGLREYLDTGTHNNISRRAATWLSQTDPDEGGIKFTREFRDTVQQGTHPLHRESFAERAAQKRTEAGRNAEVDDLRARIKAHPKGEPALVTIELGDVDQTEIAGPWDGVRFKSAYEQKAHMRDLIISSRDQGFGVTVRAFVGPQDAATRELAEYLRALNDHDEDGVVVEVYEHRPPGESDADRSQEDQAAEDDAEGAEGAAGREPGEDREEDGQAGAGGFAPSVEQRLDAVYEQLDVLGDAWSPAVRDAANALGEAGERYGSQSDQVAVALRKLEDALAEQQPSLPGAEGVRGQEVPTPKLGEAPEGDFGLTPPTGKLDRREQELVGGQTNIFDEPPAPPVPPKVESSRTSGRKATPPVPSKQGLSVGAVPGEATGGLSLQLIPGLRQFIEQDVVPKVLKGVADFAEVARGFIETWAPETMGKSAARAAGSLRDWLARAREQESVVNTYMEAVRKTLRKMPEADRWAWVDVIENPAANPQGISDPVLRAAAVVIRQVFNDRLQEIQSLGKLHQWIRDYFPHMWERNPTHEKIFGLWHAKRPWEGNKAFLKKRTIPTIKEGMAAPYNLTPISDDPIDLVMLKLHEMNKWIMARKALKEWMRTGLAKFIPVQPKSGKVYRAPKGWKQIEDPIGTVYGNPNVTISETTDKLMMERLAKLASDLGVTHDRLVDITKGRAGQAGKGALGYSIQGQKYVATKFATPEDVLAHEIGHQIDDQFGLYAEMQRLEKDAIRLGYALGPGGDKPYLQKELRLLADLRWEGQPASKGFKKYVRKNAEKMAVILQAYVHMPARMLAVAPNVFEQFRDFLDAHPVLTQIHDIQPSLVYETNKATVRAPGVNIAGYYWVPPDVHALLTNYLSPGLSASLGKLGVGVDYLRAFGNVLNQFQLGLSGFHATAETIHTMSGHLALATKYAARGDMKEALKQLARAPLTPILDPIRASNFKETYLQQRGKRRGILDRLVPSAVRTLYKAYEPSAPGSPEMERLVTHFIRGGGAIDYSKIYKMNAWENLRKAVERGNYPGALIPRVPLALIDRVGALVLESYVPRLKMTAFMDLARFEMAKFEKRGLEPTLEAHRAIMGKIINDIDDRLGQLEYDNLMWNRIFKDSLQLTFRAVGWGWGTIRALGGGALDLGRAPLKATGLMTRKTYEGVEYDPMTGQVIRSEQIPEDLLTHRAAWFVNMVFMHGLIASLYQYLHTGELPEEPKDLVYPKSGGVNEDGTPERMNIPGYMHDVINWSTQPAATVGHKLHPMWNYTLEMLQNEDFYGVETRGAPDDPAGKKVYEALRYTVKALEPFSFRAMGRRQEMKPEGKLSIGDIIEASAGVGPASAAIQRTKAGNLLRELLPGKVHRTREEAEKADVRRQVRQLSREGKTEDILATLQGGKISERSVNLAWKQGKIPGLVQQFKRLPLDDAQRVWAVALPYERAQLVDALDAKMNASDLAPDEVQKVLDWLDTHDAEMRQAVDDAIAGRVTPPHRHAP